MSASFDGYGLQRGPRIAVRLLGWGLLHDFDVLRPIVDARPPEAARTVVDLAHHLTGLAG